MRRLFKHSGWDGLLLAISILQLVFSIWLAATWESRSLLQNLWFYPLAIFLYWYNVVAIAHNFIHVSWFQISWLNRVYGIVNSANLCLPTAHYRYIHFNHHQYSNDRRDAMGQTQDLSSTFAHGKNGQHENAISYWLLAPFRDDVFESFRQARKENEALQITLESIACGAAALGYLLISWQFFLLFFLPTFYIGWSLTYLSNYYEHFGATPGERYADAVSCYNPIFNQLFCNEGYHQEHHLRPNVHWTKRPQLYQDFREQLDAVERMILRFPQVLGFLQHFDRSISQTRRS
jgi:fatty acid desaturase